MGKLARIAVNEAKELAKEQEFRRKAEAKERERLEKEQPLFLQVLSRPGIHQGQFVGRWPG